jgi:hypothetical protein
MLRASRVSRGRLAVLRASRVSRGRLAMLRASRVSGGRLASLGGEDFRDRARISNTSDGEDG